MPRPNGKDAKASVARYLGDKLRRGRIDAGYSSQESFAAKLGFDRSVVTKAETGDRPPTDDVLTMWIELCDLSPELFTELAELARMANGDDDPVPSWFADYLDDVEPVAHTIRTWQPVIMPGLLQTPGYARALFVAMGESESRIEALTAKRIERQSIIDRDNPPSLWVVLDEAVLRRRVGSESIMHEQISYLAERALLQHVGVQVVPAESGANAGCVGALTIASVDGAPDVLLTEAVEDATTENRSRVRKGLDIFDRVRYDALPRAASLELIREVAEQWKR
jgi:transcriptional regulator with XRE-family HTH domain